MNNLSISQFHFFFIFLAIEVKPEIWNYSIFEPVIEDSLNKSLISEIDILNKDYYYLLLLFIYLFIYL